MCELLIWAVDFEQSGDPGLDRHRPVSGCAITVQEDGWSWTATEKTEPHWRIVKLPGIPADAGETFMAFHPEYYSRINETAQRWAFKFDHGGALMPADFSDYWSDATRAQPSYTLNLQIHQLPEIRVPRAP